MRRLILIILACYLPEASGMQSLISSALLRNNKRPTIVKKDSEVIGKPRKFCAFTNSIHEKRIEFEFRKYLELQDYGSIKKLLRENKHLLKKKPIVDFTILSDHREELKRVHEEFIIHTWKSAGIALGLIGFTALGIASQGPGSDPSADIFPSIGLAVTPAWCIGSIIDFRINSKQEWPEKIKIIKEIEDEFYFLIDHKEIISKEGSKKISDCSKG